MPPQFDFEKEKLLLEEAATGNEQAFSQIYRNYAATVKSFVSKMLTVYNLPRQQEDDITQETFIIFSKSIGKFKLESNNGLKSWLLTVANNQIRNQLKTRKALISLDATQEKEVKEVKEIILSYKPRIDESINETQVKEIINNAIDQLDSPFKETFKVYIEFDLSIEELSNFLGVSEGTIKSRLSRARKALLPILDPLRKWFDR